jgi:cytochrome P450
MKLAQTVAARRAEPQTGLIDDLIATEINGVPMDDDEVKDLVFDILVGGFDTTAGLLAGSLLYLEGRPEVRKRLIEDDEFMRTATEEFLRYVSPAVGLAKTATQDFDLEGQPIKTGDRMWFMYRAANWDPEEFDNPDTVDLERSPNRHFAFGAGIHRCLGSNLARAVFQTVLREFLVRVPDYSVVHDQVERYSFAANNAGYAQFPIRYTPGTRVNATPMLDKI